MPDVGHRFTGITAPTVITENHQAYPLASFFFFAFHTYNRLQTRDDALVRKFQQPRSRNRHGLSPSTFLCRIGERELSASATNWSRRGSGSYRILLSSHVTIQRCVIPRSTPTARRGSAFADLYDDKRAKINLRKAGVQLSAQLLDREDRILVLRMRALQTVVHASTQAVAGQRDVTPVNRNDGFVSRLPISRWRTISNVHQSRGTNFFETLSLVVSRLLKTSYVSYFSRHRSLLNWKKKIPVKNERIRESCRINQIF